MGTFCIPLGLSIVLYWIASLLYNTVHTIGSNSLYPPSSKFPLCVTLSCVLRLLERNMAKNELAVKLCDTISTTFSSARLLNQFRDRPSTSSWFSTLADSLAVFCALAYISHIGSLRSNHLTIWLCRTSVPFWPHTAILMSCIELHLWIEGYFQRKCQCVCRCVCVCVGVSV